MGQWDEVTFARDTEVVLIPDGMSQTLPEGTRGWVTQVLGGNHTVQLETGRLVRVAAADADAIGKEAAAAAATDPGQLETGRLVRVAAADADAIGKEAAAAAATDPSAPVTADRVWDVLRTCYDPEIPLDIVELGLIYELVLKEHEPAPGVDVLVTMTLTAPGCGMGQVLADDVTAKLRGLPGVADVKVELTFDPPWSPERMSEEGRLELGMFY
jgi:probable FeS assembly SUF system protein SufT